MHTNRGRILCTGLDLNLLEIRCEVLATSGYSAQAVAIRQAQEIVQAGRFDLMVLSADLCEQSRKTMLATVGEMQILELRGITYPLELLGKVERLLSSIVSQAGV